MAWWPGGGGGLGLGSGHVIKPPPPPPVPTFRNGSIAQAYPDHSGHTLAIWDMGEIINYLVDANNKQYYNDLNAPSM